MIFDLLRRKEVTSYTAEQLAEYLRAGAGTAAGISVTPSTAILHASVFQCVRILAESIGQLPVRFLEKDEEGNRQEAPKHPLARVVSVAPNPWQTATEYWELVVAHLATRGNHYSLITRVDFGGGRFEVRELLPIAPGACIPKQRDDRSIVYEVHFANGSVDYLDPSRVFHVRLFSIDGLVGLSPIQAREALALSIATERHAARFFSNGASPGGVLQTPNILSEESYNRVRDSWEEQHEGIENAHRIALLENGLTFNATGLSAEDAQLLESRRFSQTQIAGLFRIPPHMLGSEAGKYASDEWKAQEFVQSALVPYLTRIEKRIAFQLLPPDEQARYFVKFNVAALLRGNASTRGQFYLTMQQCGALSPNEIRDFEDMNRREGGDVFLTPMNMNLTDASGAFISPPATDGGGTP